MQHFSITLIEMGLEYAIQIHMFGENTGCRKKNIEYQDYASACAEHMYVVLNLALPKRLSSSALLSEMC